MKGKNQFTQAEMDRLRELIRKRVKADKATQKRIRREMRNIGFYGRDDFGIIDLQESDLDRLIREKRITVIESPATPAKKIQTPQTPVFGNAKSDAAVPIDSHEIEGKLVRATFIPVYELDADKVPATPGIYCIKLRKGVPLPAKFGKVREDGIIYIGQASKSLKERLWEEELNHKRAATFFRSIGAMLGYLPPKGSLVGKRNTKNYKFSEKDTEAIRKWMRQSLLVNFIVLEPAMIDDTEIALIKKYGPLANLKHNPVNNDELKAARKRCIEYANTPAE